MRPPMPLALQILILIGLAFLVALALTIYQGPPLAHALVIKPYEEFLGSRIEQLEREVEHPGPDFDDELERAERDLAEKEREDAQKPTTTLGDRYQHQLHTSFNQIMREKINQIKARRQK